MSCSGRWSTAIRTQAGSKVKRWIRTGSVHAMATSSTGWTATNTLSVIPSTPLRTTAKTPRPFIQKLEDQLSVSDWVGGDAANAVDVALFPFIRQFAGVDPSWWQQAPYPNVQQWLENWLNSALFSAIMAKYPRWESGQPGERFPPDPDHGAPTHS